MRKYTNTEKQNGELIVRTLSKKAQAGYTGTDPIEVYEYEDAGKRYAVKSVDGITAGMTLAELEEYLEGWCVIWYAVMQDRNDTDWGTGSYDIEEAKRMCEGMGPDAYIAVIEEGNDPICIEEIEQGEF